jgi:hypothetical protein
MFVAKGIIVRRLERITIIFKDNETIAVKVKGDEWGGTYLFHRWFAPLGSYTGGWRDFRRKMLRNKQLDLLSCIFYAQKYDVQIHRTTRKIELKGKIIERE